MRHFNHKETISSSTIQSKLDSFKQAFTKHYNTQTCEVEILSTVTFEDYVKISPSNDIALLKSYAKALKGKKIVFINATHSGGGVAIMRAPLIALFRSLGVDARWYVLEPDEDAFKVTKEKFHNVLQNVTDSELNDSDKVLYENWIRENAKILSQPIRSADVIVIDDWQPSGLIPYIKGDEKQEGLNPRAKIIFRDHIHTEGKLMGTPGTPQYKTWRYIWDQNRVSDTDVFVVHPKEEFVPPDVPNEKVVYMPATSDLLDDLNRPLTTEEVETGIAFINQELAKNEGQKPLDKTRKYVVLIARFDPSKGMPQGIEAYARARVKLLEHGLKPNQLPQLLVVGNGSVDDPDGIPVLKEIMRIRKENYSEIKDDVKVVRVPHYDLAINALLHKATLALQPSIKEGFESRVTDAILRGVPVIGSTRGGISLQIVEGESGFLIDPDDTQQWANRIYQLFTDEDLYKRIKEKTENLAKTHNYEFTTVPNALNWLHLSLALINQPHFKGNRRWVRDLRQLVHSASS